MKEDFYADLQSTINQKKGDIFIVMGEISAKIGNNNSKRWQTIGKQRPEDIINEIRRTSATFVQEFSHMSQ
jgi:hypothetical protein